MTQAQISAQEADRASARTDETPDPCNRPHALSFPLTLNADWRVIVDDQQWQLQYCQGETWRTKAYCRTRAGLIGWVRELKLVATSSTEAITSLHMLPEYYGDAA